MTKYGATRTLNTLREELKKQEANSYSIKLTLTEPDNAGAQPYELVQMLYEKFGLNTLDLASKEESASLMADAIVQGGTLMTGIPAFGLIVDTLGDTESTENHQRSRIIEDGAKWLLKAFEEHSNTDSSTFLSTIIIENLHWADTSSIEVLQRYFELCHEQADRFTNQPSFIFNTTRHDEPWLRPCLICLNSRSE